MQIIQKHIERNFWLGRKGHLPKAIVLHRAEGLRDSVTEWFAVDKNNNDASAHYLVCKNGDILQYVDVLDTAWSNGPKQKPDLSNPLINKWVLNQENPNYETLSIETEGYATELLTNEQYASMIDLIKFLSSGANTGKYYITPDRVHVMGHYQIDSVDRAHCPNFDITLWAKIISDITPTQQVITSVTPDATGRLDSATNVIIDPVYLSFYDVGSIASYGHPLEPARIDQDKVKRQLFENVELEAYPSGVVRVGGLGQKYYKLIHG